MSPRAEIRLAMAFALLAAQPASTHADASPATIDFVTHSEIVVEVDASRVWPHILNLSDWKQGAQLVPIDNDSGKVGGRFKVVAGSPPQTAYIENVEVEPARLRTIRVDNPDGWYGYASWRLTPQGRSTLVQYDVYMRTTLSLAEAQPSSADIAAARTKLYAAQHSRFAQELAALKRLVESAPKETAH